MGRNKASDVVGPLVHSSLVVAFLMFAAADARAAEYFVGPDGLDAAGRGSELAPFATVQFAVAEVTPQPGDIITVLPGEYHQMNIITELQGTEVQPITIRAKIPGHAVFRGSELVEGFTLLAGARFVYSANVGSTPIRRVIEADTHQMLARAPSPRDLDQFRKAYYHDSSAGILYVHTSDGQPPSSHRLCISAFDGLTLGHTANGFDIIDAKYLIVEGLVFRDFSSGLGTARGSGIRVRNVSAGEGGEPFDNGLIEVRNCSFLNNAGGIRIFANNVHVHHCYFVNNVDPQNYSTGQILASGYNGTHTITVESNIVLDAPTFGIRFYDKPANCIARYNIVRGATAGLAFKADTGPRTATHNVLLQATQEGLSLNYNEGHELDEITENANTLEGVRSPSEADRLAYCDPAHQGDPAYPNYDDLCPCTDLHLDEGEDPGFVDPDHLDYRLQGDSPYLGLGAYEFVANTVFFVKPDGSDSNDGLSVASAFQTIGRAVQAADAGDTIYVLEGTYNETISPSTSGTAADPILIRGRGKDTLVNVTGGFSFWGVHHWRLENLKFHNAGWNLIQSCSDIELERCVVTNSLYGRGCYLYDVQNIAIRQCTFWNTTGATISLADTGTPNADVRITSSILQSNNDAAIDSASCSAEVVDLFCEYNDYLPGAGQPIARTKGGDQTTLSEVQSYFGQDRLSLLGVDPQLVDPTGRARIPYGSPLVARGELTENIGAGSTVPGAAPAVIQDVQFRDVTPDSISLSWWTPNHSSVIWRDAASWYLPIPANSALHVWPASDPGDVTIVPSQGDVYHRVTVTGLMPDTAYQAKIVIPDTPYHYTRAGDYMVIEPSPAPDWQGGELAGITFTTPSEQAWSPAADTYYVAPDGSDANDGLSEASPTTLTTVSDRVRAGDTVIMLPGVYHETFTPAASGRPGFPITIKASSPGAACLDGSENARPTGIILMHKQDVRIQGLAFRNFASTPLYVCRAGGHAGQVFFANCQRIEVSSCVFAGWYSSHIGANLWTNTNVTFFNNVFTGHFTAIAGQWNDFTYIRGNTFFIPQITNIAIGAQNAGINGYTEVSHNLFFGQLRSKALANETGTGDGVALAWPYISAYHDPIDPCTVNRPAYSDFNAWYFDPAQVVKYIGYGMHKDQSEALGGGLQAIQYCGWDMNSTQPAPSQVTLPGSLADANLYMADDGPGDTAIQAFASDVHNGVLMPTLQMFDPVPLDLDTGGQFGFPVGARPVNCAADLEQDGDIDAGDLAVWMTCALGPEIPAPESPLCSQADFDADGDVDLVDFAAFQCCHAGENRVPSRDCVAE